MNIYSLKKLYLILIATTLIFSFYITPVNASGLPPTVNCSTGSFTITSNVVTGHTLCTGEAIIPEGVISIGNNVFQNNTALTSVTFGSSVTSIGQEAFWNTSLTTVTIPDSVTSIGRYAFGENTALTSVTFSGIPKLTSISEGVFFRSRITSINIPNSVISIDEGAFHSTPLISVNFGNSVSSVGPYVFYGTRLTSVTIPNSVTSIGAGAFQQSESTAVNSLLTSVTFLGDAPATVGLDAFFNCTDCQLIGRVQQNGSIEANVAYNATGFPADGSLWNGLIVRYASAPGNDSGSTPNSQIITSVTVNDCFTQTFNVNFDGGSSKLKSASKSVVTKISSQIKKCNFTKIKIVGHTSIDKADTPSYKLYRKNLSSVRATNVKSAISSRLGNKGRKLSYKISGVADKNPLKSNKFEKTRSANRRVEVTLSK